MAPFPTTPRADPGIALVLVLIFTVLLYVLVAELVVTARTERLAGENDALEARMVNHMAFTLSQVEEQLADDLAAGSDDAGMPGGPSGMEGLAEPPPSGEEGEGEGDGASNVDSSQDAWFEPTAYADDDLTTYVWVEDENRKFNILSLVSRDEAFATEARNRFIRLVDRLRESTLYDISSSDAEVMANEIVDWLRGYGRSEVVPRPLLKTDTEDETSELTIPLHLDELLMLRSIQPNIYEDRVDDERLVPGLASVLTIYTSLGFDPGKPDPTQPTGQEQTPAQGEGESQPNTPGATGGAMPTEPQGLGIKININTAPRPVLRCLFPENAIPDLVIDAILRYRNEEVEEEEDPESDGFGGAEYFGDFDLGQQVKRKIFETLDDLDQLPEFKNIADPEVRDQFLSLVTVQSDVFTVHMASMYKRNEERKNIVMRRSQTVLVRIDNNGEALLHPLIRLEETNKMRVMPIDLPDDRSHFDREVMLDEMDAFAQEERRWNPFYLEFYEKDDR